METLLVEREKKNKILCLVNFSMYMYYEYMRKNNNLEICPFPNLF